MYDIIHLLDVLWLVDYIVILFNYIYIPIPGVRVYSRSVYAPRVYSEQKREDTVFLSHLYAKREETCKSGNHHKYFG